MVHNSTKYTRWASEWWEWASVVDDDVAIGVNKNRLRHRIICMQNIKLNISILWQPEKKSHKLQVDS